MSESEMFLSKYSQLESLKSIQCSTYKTISCSGREYQMMMIVVLGSKYGPGGEISLKATWH